MSNKNQYIRDQIQEINQEINDIQDYLEFAVSENWQYEVARIDLEILKEKRDRYQELLAIESISDQMQERDYENLDPEDYTKEN